MVVGVAEGRQGVRELWSRVLRWRVPGRYYLFALVALGAYLLGTVHLFDRGSSDFYFFVHVWNAFYIALAVAIVLLTSGRLGRAASEAALR